MNNKGNTIFQHICETNINKGNSLYVNTFAKQSICTLKNIISILWKPITCSYIYLYVIYFEKKGVQ